MTAGETGAAKIAMLTTMAIIMIIITTDNLTIIRGVKVIITKS